MCTIICATVSETKEYFFESRLESIDAIDRFRSSILVKKVSFKKFANPRETQSICSRETPPSHNKHKNANVVW